MPTSENVTATNVTATFPEIEMCSLLEPDLPEDPLARLEIVAEGARLSCSVAQDGAEA